VHGDQEETGNREQGTGIAVYEYIFRIISLFCNGNRSIFDK